MVVAKSFLQQKKLRIRADGLMDTLHALANYHGAMLGFKGRAPFLARQWIVVKKYRMRQPGSSQDNR